MEVGSECGGLVNDICYIIQNYNAENFVWFASYTCSRMQCYLWFQFLFGQVPNC